MRRHGHLARLRFGCHCPHQRTELFATLFEVLVCIEARARRREQHDLTRRGDLRRPFDGLGQRRDARGNRPAAAAIEVAASTLATLCSPRRGMSAFGSTISSTASRRKKIAPSRTKAPLPSTSSSSLKRQTSAGVASAMLEETSLLAFSTT